MLDYSVLDGVERVNQAVCSKTTNKHNYTRYRERTVKPVLNGHPWGVAN